MPTAQATTAPEITADSPSPTRSIAPASPGAPYPTGSSSPSAEPEGSASTALALVVSLDPDRQIIYSGSAESFTLRAQVAGSELRIARATIDFGDGSQAMSLWPCDTSAYEFKVRHVFQTSGPRTARAAAIRLCGPSSPADLSGAGPILVLPSPPRSADAWPTCSTFQLQMSGLGIGAGLGNVGVLIRIQNRSKRGCTLSGYPSIRLVGRDGSVTHTDSRQASGGDYLFPAIPPHAVALAPGAFAAFDLGYADNPFGSMADQPYDVACPSAAKLRITLPDTGEFGTVAIAVAPCNGVVDVYPIFPGRDWIGFQ